MPLNCLGTSLESMPIVNDNTSDDRFQDVNMPSYTRALSGCQALKVTACLVESVDGVNTTGLSSSITDRTTVDTNEFLEGLVAFG